MLPSFKNELSTVSNIFSITRDHYSALINLNFCFLLDYCTVNVKPDHSSETGRLKYGIEGFLASMCNESVNESIFK